MLRFIAHLCHECISRSEVNKFPNVKLQPPMVHDFCWCIYQCWQYQDEVGVDYALRTLSNASLAARMKLARPGCDVAEQDCDWEEYRVTSENIRVPLQFLKLSVSNHPGISFVSILYELLQTLFLFLFASLSELSIVPFQPPVQNPCHFNLRHSKAMSDNSISPWLNITVENFQQ